MQKFLCNVPLDLTPQTEARVKDHDPNQDDRSGPALTQGLLLTLLNMVVPDSYSEETVEAISQVDSDRWYLGQAVETVFDEMERKAPGGAFRAGRAIYFMLPAQLKQVGIVDVTSFFEKLPGLWLMVTRGDTGVFRTQRLGEKLARVEMAQPYNCSFEEGALVGFVEGLGHRAVVSRHLQCMRDGRPFCLVEVGWD